MNVDDAIIASIGPGLLALVGVARGDTEQDAAWLARKIVELRTFSDTAGKFNLSLLETGGQALLVSQFTLLGDTRKGRRPGFTEAARPEEAQLLFDRVVQGVIDTGISVKTGRFGARMVVRISNDGPVTLLLDSRFDRLS